MEVAQLVSTILSNSYTKQEVTHRLNLTRDFLEYFFFSEHEKESWTLLLNKFVNNRGKSRDDFNALFTWSSPFFDSFTKENLYETLGKIAEEMEKIPQCVIFLPFTPAIYENPKICGWFRQNIHPQFVVDIKLDRQLIGGCALVWKGKYYDFSLRYYLEKNKTRILGIIDEYLKEKEPHTST